MRTRVLVLVLLLALGSAACTGGGGDSRVITAPATPRPTGTPTGEPIRVGALFDLRGPTSDAGVSFAAGVRSQVEWVNATGGVAGRPLRLLGGDHRHRARRARQLQRQRIDAGAVAVVTWGSVAGEALAATASSRRVPLVAAASAPRLARAGRSPFSFVSGMPSPQQLRIALRHIAESSDGHVEVAVLHHDSVLGRTPLAAGEAYIAEHGLDIGYRTYRMRTGAADHREILTEVQDQGADYLIVNTAPGPAAQLAQNVSSQRLDATVVCLAWCADDLFVELGGDAVQGALGVLPWAPPDQARGDLSAVVGQLQSQGSALADADLHYTRGWYHMAVLVEAIERVVAGGVDPTGRNVRRSLELLGAFETPVSAPVDFTAERHAGLRAASLHRVEDGAWQRLTEPRTP